MKKLLSVLISITMLASVSLMAVPALASVNIESPKGMVIYTINSPTVNKKPTNNVKVDYDEETSIITFTYNGDGDLTGWDFGKAVEGTDYTVLKSTDNSITIQVLNWDAFDVSSSGAIVVNAEVKNATETTTKETEKNNDSKSPNTGSAISVATVAVLGAGIVLTSVLKKKNDAE